jgi:two-component system chemotaxis response regulator CheY
MTTSKKTLLVVEDDASIRELLEELFLSEGYDVLLAENGEHALRRLSEEKIRPHVILLDLSMAVMDGRTFLKQLPVRCPECASIPVLLMTAAGVAEIPAHPTSQILRKPLDIDKLLNTVAQFADLNP